MWRNKWRRGIQNGAIRQNAQTIAPIRVAGRCTLRRRPKGATAFTCTFFFIQLQPLARRFAEALLCRNLPTRGPNGGFWGGMGGCGRPAQESGTQGFIGADKG